MALIQSDWAKLTKSSPYPSIGGGVVAQRFSVDVTAAQMVLNNIIEMGPIPPGCRPIDMILDSDDIDSVTSAALDVGIMSGTFGDNDAARTCGAEFFAANTVGQAGGSARPTLKTAFRVASTQTVRSIGVKFQAAPATPVAGTIGLTVLYATD